MVPGRKGPTVFRSDLRPLRPTRSKLADLHRRNAGNGFSILMVGRGDAQENRRKAKEHGLEFPIVVQDRWKLSKEYGTFATPVAFLIGKDGIIEQNVAEGPEKILALAREAGNRG